MIASSAPQRGAKHAIRFLSSVLGYAGSGVAAGACVGTSARMVGAISLTAARAVGATWLIIASAVACAGWSDCCVQAVSIRMNNKGTRNRCIEDLQMA